MDETTKISVIIPVYNVEPYLRQCLDSVVSQTYGNLDIILIDDGSPDQSGTICDEYGAKDQRISVLHKENRGVHAAWNDGLRAAKGEWIAFVDSDDWLEQSYFEMLLSAPRGENTDIIIANEYFREEQKGQYRRAAFLESFQFKDGEGVDYLRIHSLIRSQDERAKGTLGYLWNKIYKTELLRSGGFIFDDNIRTGLMGDVLFNFDVYGKARDVIGIIYCGYHYRILSNSGSFKYDPNRTQSQMYVQEQFNQRIDRPDVSQNLKKAFESRCLRDIVHNLQYSYFHPQNIKNDHDIAEEIASMKKMTYYHQAIYSKNNPYNGRGLRLFQLALRTPWVWPLRLMVWIWERYDRRE